MLFYFIVLYYIVVHAYINTVKILMFKEKSILENYRFKNIFLLDCFCFKFKFSDF
jgi:hypothetical protein